MVVIIPCGAKKRTQRAPAYAMYLGPYYSACLRYALSIADRERVFILSAKYGLLGLEDVIKPYDLKMGDAGCVSVETVIEQAREREIADEKAICLGGRAYTEIMRQVWAKYATPLDGVGGMGKQIQWLKHHRGVIP